MVEASKVTAEIYADKVPQFPKVTDYIQRGFLPGGTKTNAKFVAKTVEWNNKVPDYLRTLLVDAQTSGGLLLSVPIDDAENILNELRSTGLTDSSIIGKIIGKSEGKIIVK